MKNCINYCRIADAISLYTRNGYKYVDVPRNNIKLEKEG